MTTTYQPKYWNAAGRYSDEVKELQQLYDRKHRELRTRNSLSAEEATSVLALRSPKLADLMSATRAYYDLLNNGGGNCNDLIESHLQVDVDDIPSDDLWDDDDEDDMRFAWDDAYRTADERVDLYAERAIEEQQAMGDYTADRSVIDLRAATVEMRDTVSDEAIRVSDHVRRVFTALDVACDTDRFDALVKALEHVNICAMTIETRAKALRKAAKAAAAEASRAGGGA